jgi:hypothetical protein
VDQTDRRIVIRFVSKETANAGFDRKEKKVTKELIREALQDFVDEGVSLHTSLWASTREQLSSGPVPGITHSKRAVSSGAPLSVFRPKLNISAILVLLLGFAAFATFFAIRNNSQAPGALSSPNAIAALQGNPISQTVNGYTVTLYPSYAPEGWLSLSYVVIDGQGHKRPLFDLTENGLYVNYRNNTVEGTTKPNLVDAEGHSYPVIGVGPSFAWSDPTQDAQKVPITDLDAHKIEGGQGKEVCCLADADVVMWNFDPLPNATQDTTRNMHLEITVFLPEDALQAKPNESENTSGIINLQSLNYKDTVESRLAFDFSLPSK